MDDNVEKEISSDVTLKIIDMILVNETSLNKAAVRKKERKEIPLILFRLINSVLCLCVYK